MNDIILQGCTKEELIRELSSNILSKLNGLLPDSTANTPQSLKDKKQAAAYLNISCRTLDTITKKSNLKYSWIEGSVRFKQSELDAYISKHEVKIKR